MFETRIFFGALSFKHHIPEYVLTPRSSIGQAYIRTDFDRDMSKSVPICGPSRSVSNRYLYGSGSSTTSMEVEDGDCAVCGELIKPSEPMQLIDFDDEEGQGDEDAKWVHIGCA